MADLKVILRVGVEEFVDGTGGAGELGIIIIVDNDNSLAGEARRNKLEASLNGAIKVAITESKTDLGGEILSLELIKPSFFNDNASGGEIGMGGDF